MAQIGHIHTRNLICQLKARKASKIQKVRMCSKVKPLTDIIIQERHRMVLPFYFGKKLAWICQKFCSFSWDKDWN